MAMAQPRLAMPDEPVLDPENQTVSVSRELRKHGGSTVVSLHPKVLEAVGLSEGDDVEITARMDTKEIVIQPAKDDE